MKRIVKLPPLALQTIRFVDGDINLTPTNTGKGEFRVNTTTTRDQFFPSVAALADGGYVVAWKDDMATPGQARRRRTMPSSIFTPVHRPTRLSRNKDRHLRFA